MLEIDMNECLMIDLGIFCARKHMTFETDALTDNQRQRHRREARHIVGSALSPVF